MADLDVSGPFTRRQARLAGIDWRALAGPRHQRPFRGVYLRTEAVAGVQSIAAAALMVAKDSEAVASHHTAALLWGGVVPETAATHVTVPAGHTRRRTAGLVVHEGDRQTLRRRGVPVTAPADTFVDLARYLGLVDLVVLGDSLVGAGVVSLEGLQTATEKTGRHMRLARRAAGLVRAGVDSPMETKSRLLIVLAGLPEPEVNHRLRDADGTVRRRLDMAYPQVRLAIEYDGRQHAESTQQWQGDVYRREELDGMRWRLVVLLANDIYRTPQRTIDRIRAAMGQCGMQVPAGTDEWRLHFA